MSRGKPPLYDERMERLATYAEIIAAQQHPLPAVTAVRGTRLRTGMQIAISRAGTFLPGRSPGREQENGIPPPGSTGLRRAARA